MRRARITYKGAYHHIMNRGINGMDIFGNDSFKDIFLQLLKEKIRKLHIRLFAYCIMTNHYHLVLENSSERLTDFMKQLNGHYGLYYRRETSGKGYVFQERFKSTLIQDESYLIMAIAYVLQNPLKANLAKTYDDYQWSSGREYFAGCKDTVVDNQFVNDLFGSKEQMKKLVISKDCQDLPIIKTQYGPILGEKSFINRAVSKYNRRTGKDSVERQRASDKHFEPLEKIYMEFEKKHQIQIKDIDTRTYKGKQIRSELLIWLKDIGGLKYSEIIKLDPFSDLQINSLGSIYSHAQKTIRTK